MTLVQDAFAGLAAYGKVSQLIADDQGTDEVVFELASGEFFTMLGVRPALGRLPGREDDLPGRPLVAAISNQLWRSRYAEDPGVLGQHVTLSGHDATIVGVLPRGFEDLAVDWNGPASVWVPLETGIDAGFGPGRTSPFYWVTGRMRPGVGADGLAERAQAWLPELPLAKNNLFEGNAIRIAGKGSMRLHRSTGGSTFLGGLLAVCILILLAACFNVANVFLGRAITRRREMALRASLGATNGRLAQQLVTER